MAHLESVAQWPTSRPPEPSSCPRRVAHKTWMSEAGWENTKR